MKKHQIKELSIDELKTKLSDNLEALENLRFQKAMQQLENPLKIKDIRKEIAQLKTVLHEYDLEIRK